MSEPRRDLGRFVGTTLRVVARRLIEFAVRRNSRWWLAGLLAEVLGLALFATGLLSSMAFLSADSPAEAARRGLANLPIHCEAGYFNHGAYTCWYTIADHPFLFAASIGTAVVGGATFAWAQRRRFSRGGGRVA